MSRRQQFIVVFATVLILSSALSHLIVRAIGIRTDVIDRGKINTDAPGAPVLVMGSSLTFFGITFREVAKAMQRPLITRSVGGCSPCELEPLALEVPDATRTILGVSVFDLNENSLSDSRATLVSFGQTLGDLRASGADWTSSKRVIWSYPIPWVQGVFPVAGRSTAVMVNMRDKVRSLRRHDAAPDPEAKLSFKTDEDASRPEKLSDWDAGRVSRNLSQLAASGLPHGHFTGPKSLALSRILTRAAHREPTIILVLPVSPPYRQTFVDAAAEAEFEQALDRIQKTDPALQMIRLDREPSLQPAEVFWDLVHFNDAGRKLATRLVIDKLSASNAR